MQMACNISSNTNYRYKSLEQGRFHMPVFGFDSRYLKGGLTYRANFAKNLH